MRNHISKTATVLRPLSLVALTLAACAESPVLDPGAGGPAASRALSAAPRARQDRSRVWGACP